MKFGRDIGMQGIMNNTHIAYRIGMRPFLFF